MKLNFLQLATIATTVFAADPQATAILDIAKGQAAIPVPSPYQVAFTPNKLNQLLAVRTSKQVLNKDEAEELGKLIGLRTDVQTGSTPSNSGTTSLAMKGAAPKILGFALENGAIESSTKGTVVTFRATPWGVLKALKGSGYLDILDSLASNGEAGFLKKISVAASFDTSKGVETPTLLANRQQLQSWSVRSELFNNRDASLRAYHQFWGQLADQAATDLKSNQGIIFATLGLGEAMDNWPNLEAWYSDCRQRVQVEIETPALTGTNLETAFLKIAEEQLIKFDKLKPPESVVVAIKSYVPELKSVLISRNAIANYAQRGALATVDFTVKRDPVLPDLSTLTGIWETHIGKRLGKTKESIRIENLEQRRNHDLTINGAISFFNSPAKLASGKQNQMRDFKLTTQYDIPLGKIEKLGSFVWTNAFKYQRLFEDAPISLLSGLNSNLGNPPSAGTVVAIAKKGNFAIYQTKLTIPAGTGVRIPLSFSIANRSELLSEKKDINANIGITFDVDALFAKASK